MAEPDARMKYQRDGNTSVISNRHWGRGTELLNFKTLERGPLCPDQIFVTTPESRRGEKFVAACSFGMFGSRKIIGNNDRVDVIVRLVSSICDDGASDRALCGVCRNYLRSQQSIENP